MASVVRGPDFICFGMQRAGTRWLYDQVAGHPDAWMPPVKEIGHFNDKPFKPANNPDRLKYPPHGYEQLTADERDAFFRAFTPERRAADPDRWYLDLFAAKNGRISGDVSPEYAALRGANIRAALSVCPDARYLFLIRDPVDRFWSAVNLHLRANHYEPARLQRWPELRAMLAGTVHRRRSYPSRIWKHWRNAGPDIRMQFAFYDQIREHPSEARAAIFAFLDLDPARSKLPADFDRKAGQAKLPLPPALRRTLTEYFMPEYEACAETFGGRAVDWLTAARERLAFDRLGDRSAGLNRQPQR
jgi:hypothetical protein